jgi:hypothetical protein
LHEEIFPFELDIGLFMVEEITFKVWHIQSLVLMELMSKNFPLSYQKKNVVAEVGSNNGIQP